MAEAIQPLPVVPMHALKDLPALLVLVYYAAQHVVSESHSTAPRISRVPGL